ncbi:hypothetical protein RRG08_031177 [Elysia crispata]|uniref:Uncharacterized protein n=1 Tax=Elysia crispata TaxID=231223 RepID=A0AAE1DF42_9GAST|nr:hypothetical protein RRG08_031177 [Elysia crispata]
MCQDSADTRDMNQSLSQVSGSQQTPRDVNLSLSQVPNTKPSENKPAARRTRSGVVQTNRGSPAPITAASAAAAAPVSLLPCRQAWWLPTAKGAKPSFFTWKNNEITSGFPEVHRRPADLDGLHSPEADINIARRHKETSLERRENSQKVFQRKRVSEVKDARGLEVNDRRDPDVHDTRGPEVNDRRDPDVHDTRGPEVNDRRDPDVHDTRGPEVNDRHVTRTSTIRGPEVNDDPDVHDTRGPEVNDRRDPDVHDTRGPEVNDRRDPDVHDTRGPEVNDRRDLYGKRWSKRANYAPVIHKSEHRFASCSMFKARLNAYSHNAQAEVNVYRFRLGL